jgi:hypothetical protein
MFPKLGDAEIERLTQLGVRGHVEAGAVVVEQGDETHGVFIVIRVVSKSWPAPMATARYSGFSSGECSPGR